MSLEYHGLAIVAPTGVTWQWVGHTWVTNRHGVDVRVERWQAPCRFCGAPFTVLAKLPGGYRHRFLARRTRAREAGQSVNVQLSAPTERPIKMFQMRNCKAHRRLPDPAELI